MRILIPLTAAFLLAACTHGGKPIDPKEFFATLEGPKVPTVQDTLLESAKNAEKQGDFTGAGQIYQRILEKQPENKEVTLALAETYRRSGDNDRAIALYDALLQKDPAMLGAKEGKGLALMTKGDFDTPAVLFDEIMKADAGRWKTLNALGILFTTRNMYDEARQYFDAALKASPSNPSVMNNLGLSHALNRNFDPALSTLMQASALTGAATIDRKRVDLNLALVYAIAGRPEDASAIAAQHLSGPTLSNNQGLYAHLAKDDQLAKAYLNMALTESKTFYEKAWNNLQTIDSASTGGTGALAPAAAPVAEEAEKPAARPKKKRAKAKAKPAPVAEDSISNIVNSTDEADKVQDSPIP
jgi:Flp pilus assembly protein TadD